MGLLSGSISVTRFTAAGPEPPDFERLPFRPIMAGSEVRESLGFVPYEPDAPWEVGARRWAFRVRIDTLKPDATAVRERLKELIKTELETTGAPSVGPKKRKKLRLLAEEELIIRAAPRSKVIECALDGGILYVGSTAKSYLGTVILLLRQLGIEADYKTPWIEKGLAEEMSEIYEPKQEPESLHGCRFLGSLVGDPELMVEPESGRVKLATREARITLAGEVLKDLHRYLDEGAEVLSAKLLHRDRSFTLNGPTFQVTGLRLSAETTTGGHWTERLDERLAAIADLYEVLEGKFERRLETAS